MQSPNFASFQFINASGMNAAFSYVSGSFAQGMSGQQFPGLVHPESVSLVGSGLTVNITAPLPFQTLFGTGVLAAAVGTTTGVVSNAYAVSFSGLVPATGASVTAYLAVSATSIQENATAIIGPPPGHPDYNPLFVPVTAYLTNIDSIIFYASLTPPDGFNTFEVARMTLASGATGVGSIITAYQTRSADLNSSQIIQAAGTVTMSVNGYGGRTTAFLSSGAVFMQSAALANGVTFTYYNGTAAGITITASGADLIYGTSTQGGLGNISLGAYSQVELTGVLGGWVAAGISQTQAGGGFLGLSYGGLFTSGTPVFLDGYYYNVDTTAGSFSGTYSGAAAIGSNWALNFAGTNPFTIIWGASGSMFKGDPTPTPIYPEGLYPFSWSGPNRGFP